MHGGEAASVRISSAFRLLFLGLAIVLAAGSIAAVSRSGEAQEQPDDHAAHHGGAAPTPSVAPAVSENPPAPAATTPPDSMPVSPPPAMAGMGDMMGRMMGGGLPKQLFPALMDVPVLTLDAKRQVEEQARTRIGAGTQAITQGEEELHRAVAANDPGAMAQSLGRIRDGQVQVESGAAVLRALAEGKPPQQIALTWFKSQLNLAPTTEEAASAGPLGLSWFHLIAMAAIVMFGLAMMAIYAARMRRAAALVDRLTSAAPAFPDIAALAGAGPPIPGPPKTTPQASAPAAVVRRGPWVGSLRVARIFRETPRVKTFRLANPSGGPIPFTYMPGQFLTFTVEIGDRQVKRSYTIASSPTQTAHVDVTVKREEAGTVSCFLHDLAAEGADLQVAAPSGDFIFRGAEADSIVLIGGGVGITPLMSITRYLADCSWPGEIFLLYGAKTVDEFIFREELEYLQRRDKNLHVAAIIEHPGGSAWMGPRGLISKEFIVQAVPDIARRRIHVCGPPPMMDSVRRLLAELAVPKEQIKTEAFGPARGALPPPSVADDVVSTGVTGPATAWVRFATSGKAAPLLPDKSVLEAAESIGVPIDYSCRVGTCGICKVRLLKGTVTMGVEESLSAEEKERGLILACQAKSVGDLVVEA